MMAFIEKRGKKRFARPGQILTFKNLQKPT
jgi:hypothetical protein